MTSRATRHTVPRHFRHAAQAVAIGASAGGVDALLQLLAPLPASFALPVIAVLHQTEDRESLLASVFGQRCALRVQEAADKSVLEPGTLYFAPPGYHLLLEADCSFSLSCDRPEHFSRPSIDVLLDSATDALGPALVAILLTGANDDGAAGIARARAQGALTVVQDPQDAQWPEMPRAALALCEPAFVLNLKDIHRLMTHLEPLACPRPSC